GAAERGVGGAGEVEEDEEAVEREHRGGGGEEGGAAQASTRAAASPGGARSDFPKLLTGRTGHGACCTTLSATLPRANRFSPVRPCVASTMRSAGRRSAAARMPGAGLPSSTWTSPA